MRKKLRPLNGLTAAVAVSVAAALLLSACSSNATTESESAVAASTAAGAESPAPASASAASEAPESGAKVDEAKAIVEEGLKPLEWNAPGPALDVGTQFQGKELYFVSAALAFEFTQNILKGMTAAADEVGMKIVALDAKGDISTAARQIEQAISQDAAAIAIMSFSAASLSAPIEEAKAAGIPVFTVLDGDPGLPTPEEAELGVVGKVTYNYTVLGQQLAALAVAQGEGDVHAALIGVPDTPAAVLESEGFKTELARLCPECQVEEFGSNTAQWGAELPAIGTAIGQNESLNFVVPVFAVLGAIMKPTLLAAGAEDRLSMVTVNTTEPTVVDLQNGEFITGISGNPEDWMGWAVMDQVLRVLTGQPAVADVLVHSRVFTSANAEAYADPKDVIYTDDDYAAEYLNLWGLG